MAHLKNEPYYYLLYAVAHDSIEPLCPEKFIYTSINVLKNILLLQFLEGSLPGVPVPGTMFMTLNSGVSVINP